MRESDPLPDVEPSNVVFSFYFCAWTS